MSGGVPQPVDDLLLRTTRVGRHRFVERAHFSDQSSVTPDASRPYFLLLLPPHLWRVVYNGKKSDEMKLKFGEAFVTCRAAEGKNACYVLSLACNARHILAQLSDHTLLIIDSNSLQQVASKNFADISLVSAHLLDDDSVVIVTKSGRVVRWEQRWTRTTDILSLNVEGAACSALSRDQTRLAVGTEKKETESQQGKSTSSDSESDGDDDDEASSTIVIVDLQSKAQLATFTESHSDSINWLAFNPDDRDRLISGGADGLVNWFQLSNTEAEEEDALVQTFDCGSSLSRVGWMKDAERGTGSFSVTDDNRLTLFDIAEDGDASVVFKTVNFKEGRSLVDCFTDGEAIYSVSSDDSGKAYLSRRVRSNDYATALTTDDHCHAHVIRCLAYDDRGQTLLTGGEDGTIIGRQVVFERDLTVAKKTRRSKKKGAKPY